MRATARYRVLHGVTERYGRRGWEKKYLAESLWAVWSLVTARPVLP